MFAFDLIYSKNVMARRPALKAWNALVIRPESIAREYPLTRPATALVLSIKWMT